MKEIKDSSSTDKAIKGVARIIDVYMKEDSGNIKTEYQIIYTVAGIVAVIAATAITITVIRRRKHKKVKQRAQIGRNE